MIRFFLAAGLTLAASLATAQAWPTSDLRDYVDYREPSPFASLSYRSDVFKDVAYPQGVLFSTVTGSLYWYDEASNEVTCLIAMNGVVTGLSMSIDRKVYSFSLNGTPYLWRPGSRPGVFLTEVGLTVAVRSDGHDSLELNALGTAAILTTTYINPYEVWSKYALIDLKTMTLMRSFDTNTTGFTPSGRYVVECRYDYDHPDVGGNIPFVWEAFGLDGITSQVRVEVDSKFRPASKRTDPNFNGRSARPDWYKNRTVPDTISGQVSWESLGLPGAQAPALPPGVHRATWDDGLSDVVSSPERDVTRIRSDATVIWTRKMREYSNGSPYYDTGQNSPSRADAWLDTQSNSLLLLMTRPGPANEYGYATFRMILRFLDWKTGDKAGSDIELRDNDVTSILEWVPGQYVALGEKDGRRLEYWFKTDTFISGNGTTAFRGRVITSFYPSANGSLTYDKADTQFTMTRFKGQIGGVTNIVVRDDQNLVAEIDEGGQMAIRRVAEDKVLVVITLKDSRIDPSAIPILDEGDAGTLVPPSAAPRYSSAVLMLQVGPTYLAKPEK